MLVAVKKKGSSSSTIGDEANSMQLKFFNFYFIYTQVFISFFSLFLVNYVIFHVGFYAKLKIVFLCFSLQRNQLEDFLHEHETALGKKKKIGKSRIISH